MKERDSREAAPHKATISQAVGDDFKRPSTIIEPVDGPIPDHYADQLAFMEEPVTVRFSPPHQKFGLPWVEATCNGTGIEVFMNNRWLKLGQVPTGRNVITKRKYLEILANAKETSVEADYTDVMGGDPVNNTRYSTTLKYAFTVIQDTPRGNDWMSRLLEQPV